MSSMVAKEYDVAKGQAIAFRLLKEETVRFVNHVGPQVGTVCFFNSHNYHEQFSARWSAFLDTIAGEVENFKRLTKLYSKVPWENPMLSVVADTDGVHFPGRHCSKKVLELRPELSLIGGRTCHDNLAECLAQYGLTADRVDVSNGLSLFMNWKIDEEDVLRTQPPHAKKGSYIEFRAEMDLLAAFSNCPVAAEYNDFECKDMKVQIFK